MAVISIPNNAYFDSVDALRLQRAGVAMRSRYTGKRQSAVFSSAIWVLEGTLIDMDGQDAADWRSFLAQLRGTTNTFRLPVPGVANPLSGYNAQMTFIANGTFTSNTAGWTARNGATLSSTGGRLRVTNTADFGEAYISFSTLVGRTYTLTYSSFTGTGPPQPYLGSAGPGSADLYNDLSGVGIVGRTVTFIATSTTTTLTLRVNAVGVGPYAEFDDVQVTGYLAPTVNVAGAAVNAKSMPVNTANNALLLKNGDYFTVNDELKIATTDVVADGSGIATVNFEPGLRQAVTGGMILTLDKPYVLLAAADNDVAGWGLAHPVLQKVKLKAVEAF